MTNAEAMLGISPLREVRSKWGWFVLLGAVLVVLGFVAFANLIIATLVSVLYVGILMTVGAIAQIVHAFQVKTWAGFFYWLLSGIFYGAAGVITWLNPVLAAVTLTLLLAVMLIVAGLLRIWSGFKLRGHSAWGWGVASGLITLLAGIIFLIGWPVNSLWLLGLVLAIDLTFQGIAAIGVGFTLKASH
jgi:uncharacterized membrane protein HdeD (DUF308 family)